MGLAKEVSCVSHLIELYLMLSVEAPGFQTSVRKIRVTPEIAARLRRGEEVSPEEIAAASAQAEEQERPRDIVETRLDVPSPASASPSESPVNEWLPENLTAPKRRGKGKRK